MKLFAAIIVVIIVIVAPCRSASDIPHSDWKHLSYANAPLYEVKNIYYNHKKGEFFYLHDSAESVRTAQRAISKMPDVNSAGANQVTVSKGTPFRLSYATKLKVNHISEAELPSAITKNIQHCPRDESVLFYEAGWDNRNIFHWYQDVSTRLFSLCRRGLIGGVNDKVLIAFMNLNRGEMDSYRLGWLNAAIAPCPNVRYAFADELPFADQGQEVTCFHRALFKSGRWWLRYGAAFPYDDTDSDWLRRSAWEQIHKGVVPSLFNPKTGLVSQVPMNALVLRRSTNRMIINEEEVVAALEKYGFKVSIGDWSLASTFDEQAAKLINTGLLVGVHGAGLTHAALMPACGAVIEIKPLYTGTPYDYLSFDSGHQYESMVLSKSENFEFFGYIADHCKSHFSEFASINSQECRLSRKMCIQCLLESSKLRVDIAEFEEKLATVTKYISRANVTLKSGRSCNPGKAPSKRVYGMSSGNFPSDVAEAREESHDFGKMEL